MSYKMLVCGSRDYIDGDFIASVLDEWPDTITHLCHGGARGADTLAGAWASKHPSIEVVVYRAQWAQLGRSAGPVRNIQMLEQFRPDAVLAFKNGFDQSLRRGGTEHMVKISRAAGIASVVIFDNEWKAGLFS